MAASSILWGVLSTSRPATSLLHALLGSLFLFLNCADPRAAFTLFPILLLLCMATFSINDLLDAEQDRINHPKRFLVTNPSAKRLSTAYYLLLILAFCFVSADMAPIAHSWIYISALVIFTNYSIIKSNIPLFKNIYIAMAHVAFCFAVFHAYQINAWASFYAGVFLVLTAREILMDIPDMKGDHDSIARRLGPRPSFSLAIGLNVLAAAIIMPHLWPSRLLLAPIGFVFPIMLFIRMRYTTSACAVGTYTRVVSGLPLLYSAYLVTAS